MKAPHYNVGGGGGGGKKQNDIKKKEYWNGNKKKSQGQDYGKAYINKMPNKDHQIHPSNSRK